jgi:hypothetical protein
MTEGSIPRYPLEWPLGWRRSRSRRNGQFKHDGNWINVDRACRRLEAQLEKLGVKESTLSSNVSLNMRGIPRGDENPSDPGVAIYFAFKGKATVLACDTYFRVADNIAALAAHLEALRAIDRYGVGTIEQALAGYKALPADTAADWRAVFGFAKGSRPTRADIDTVYKRLAREKHPDAGGTEVEMMHLNRARDYAASELGEG